MQQEPNQEVVDCAACGFSGHNISGDLNSLEKLMMKTDARYIIVVEKVLFFWLSPISTKIVIVLPQLLNFAIVFRLLGYF